MVKKPGLNRVKGYQSWPNLWVFKWFLKGNSGMEATLVQNKVYLPLIIVLLFVFTKLALSVSNRGKGLNFFDVLDDAIFFIQGRSKLDTRFQNEASWRQSRTTVLAGVWILKRNVTVAATNHNTSGCPSLTLDFVPTICFSYTSQIFGTYCAKHSDKKRTFLGYTRL